MSVYDWMNVMNVFVNVKVIVNVNQALLLANASLGANHTPSTWSWRRACAKANVPHSRRRRIEVESS